jgi:HEAT repeat protein
MIRYIYVVLLSVVLSSYYSQAQTSADKRTTTTKIADLLAQLPARDSKQLQSSMLQISQLGENGYVQLIASLKEAGKESNALLEYAISGYSSYVMQRGHEAERSQSVIAYGKALNEVPDKKNKAFIISQLEVVGENDAIPYLERHLTDPNLADPTARALVKINTNEAKTALLTSLSQADIKARLSIVQALGLSRVRDAIPAITKLIGQDESLTKVSLTALAQIADPSSAAVIDAAAKKSQYQYDNTNAVAAMLIYANRLLEESNNTLATQIAETIQKNAVSDIQVHTRIAALDILARCVKGNPTSLLVAAVDDKHIAYRSAALKLAGQYLTPEITPLWLKKIGKSSPIVKAEIVDMLGAYESKVALPAIAKLLRSKDQQLKFAAISAASRIGQDKMIPVFYQIMQKGDSSTIASVTSAIQTMKGGSIATQTAAYLPKAKPAVQVAIIQILASRAAHDQINTIYGFLSHKNSEVRQAAFSSLKKIVTTADLPKLFTLLKERTSPTELEDIQEAVIAAIHDLQNNDGQMDNKVLEQLSIASPEKKPLYYKILASSGSTKALHAVRSAYIEGPEANKHVAISALASWTNPVALPELLHISRETADTGYVSELLKGYLRLVETTEYTPEQKYLKLREAMQVAKTTTQKIAVLRALAQAKTYNALIFTGTFLSDAEVSHTAAQSVMNIALSNPSYNGSEVRNLLNQTMETLRGDDSEYEKEAIRKHLAEWGNEGGFVRLFNGKDLSGWKGLVGDPIKRSKMDPKALEAAQEKANAAMKESWTVKDGELRFTSHGDNIATVKKYGDFELLIDWKIIDDKKQNGDAGIYLRGTPQVQIWDTARIKDGAQVGSGGLYNNQIHESKPLTVADNKLDEWNTFRILMKGDRVTVYLNGILVTDNVILENYWDRNLPIFAEEQIELQAHGSPVAYRDIFIREIPRPRPSELTAREKKEGFNMLFDGTNFHHWIGNTQDYVIENGNIAVRPISRNGSGGNLFTKDQYGDFILWFDFQLTPGANNGLGIRAPLTGDAAYEGMELQILDNEAPIYKDLKPYQYHGSIYGISAAKRGFLKPVGEWNIQEVMVKGNKVKVDLNGTVILDTDITSARENGAADGKSHPGLSRSVGHIGFLGHSSVVQFKNIRIKNLSTKNN